MGVYPGEGYVKSCQQVLAGGIGQRPDLRPHHLPLSADEHTSSQAVQRLRLFYRRFSGGCHYADTLLQRNEPGDREKAMTLLNDLAKARTYMGLYWGHYGQFDLWSETLFS